MNIQPYRISITGPESTGKTTLARQLGSHFRTRVVQDYSRMYISGLARKYNRNDVIKIAGGIMAIEDEMTNMVNEIMISDNDLVNIKIWLEYYNWEVPEWLNRAVINRPADLYLLCYPDITWVPDGQRANPHDRVALFSKFEDILAGNKANYKILYGNGLERFSGALEAVDNLVGNILQ